MKIFTQINKRMSKRIDLRMKELISKQLMLKTNKKHQKINYIKKKEKKIIKKIYIKTSVNNTIISTLNFKKNYILSCGQLGFQGAKRGSTYAAQKLGERIGRLIYDQKEHDEIIIILRGIKKGKRNTLNGLKKRLIVRKVVDITSPSHNGCRPRKKKRK